MNGWLARLDHPWRRTRVDPPRPVRPLVVPQVPAPRGPTGLVWRFSRNGPDTPEWLDGYEYPITIDDAEALVGTSVNVRFDYAADHFPDGTVNNYRPMMVTITDNRSDLEVHERTFQLAADAFIIAAKRMRLER